MTTTTDSTGTLIDKWQPIETAPRDGSDVLLWRPNVWGQAIPIVAGWYDNGRESGWSSYDKSSDWIDGDVTHWMPLPGAPRD